MDERPRNLKTMLSEAKDTSELMIDLGYAAVYFGDTAMAEEVEEREDRLSDLIAELRQLAGAPAWEPPQAPEEPAVSDLDRAIDVLVEMKNISEVAVGLAYSALVLRDQGLAAEVNHLEDRLDEMMERLELWVLRAAQERVDPGGLRGLLHLAQAAEEIGDAAQQMVWLVEEGEELHPILALALGDAEEVVVRVPVAAGSPADGKTLGELH